MHSNTSNIYDSQPTQRQEQSNLLPEVSKASITSGHDIIHTELEGTSLNVSASRTSRKHTKSSCLNVGEVILDGGSDMKVKTSTIVEFFTVKKDQVTFTMEAVMFLMGPACRG